jgi:thymidylate kinase
VTSGAAEAPWIVVTGLDGSGKSHLVEWLARKIGARRFRLPYHPFVQDCLKRSGEGSQFGDVHTDRLLFALDGRLANYLIRRWRAEGTRLVSQRGWTDNFVFGAVQGISYEETEEMLRSRELERASAYVHLVAEPHAAFARIKADPERDKFETADFLVPQYDETLRLFREIEARNPVFAEFHDIPKALIDTTRMANEEVCAAAWAFLEKAVPELAQERSAPPISSNRTGR